MWAAIAALGYGTADFLGGAATKRISVTRTLLWSHVVGLFLAMGSLAVIASEPIRSDLVAGATAGVFGMGGLVFLYSGLARGRAAIVAPTAAVVGSVIPIAFGFVMGERLSGLGWLGVLLAIPSMVLVSSSSEVSRRAGGVGFGVGAGVFFGGYFVALADTATASGLWPLVSSRSTSVLLLGLFAIVARRSDLQPVRGGVGAIVIGAGVLDLVGNVGFLIGTRVGSLVIVSVVATLYPAVTVTASRFVNGETLSGNQLVGVVGSVASIALLAIG